MQHDCASVLKGVFADALLDGRGCIPACCSGCFNAPAVQDGVRGSLPLYKGVRDAARTILKDEGWRSLYAGLTPALIGAGVRTLGPLIAAIASYCIRSVRTLRDCSRTKVDWSFLQAIMVPTAPGKCSCSIWFIDVPVPAHRHLPVSIGVCVRGRMETPDATAICSSLTARQPHACQQHCAGIYIAKCAGAIYGMHFTAL